MAATTKARTYRDLTPNLLGYDDTSDAPRIPREQFDATWGPDVERHAMAPLISTPPTSRWAIAGAFSVSAVVAWVMWSAELTVAAGHVTGMDRELVGAGGFALLTVKLGQLMYRLMDKWADR